MGLNLMLFRSFTWQEMIPLLKEEIPFCYMSSGGRGLLLFSPLGSERPNKACLPPSGCKKV
jgi:hypothetical protein